MANWKDKLTTRKRAPKKIEMVFNIPEGPQGGLGSVSYSGAGPDGIIQPDRIAYRTPQGDDIHEDELVVRGARGDTVVPSPLTPQQPGTQVPRTREEQMRMAQTARGPGYQWGNITGQIGEKIGGYLEGERKRQEGLLAARDVVREGPPTFRDTGMLGRATDITGATGFRAPRMPEIPEREAYAAPRQAVPGGLGFLPPEVTGAAATTLRERAEPPETRTAMGEVTPPTPALQPTITQPPEPVEPPAPVEPTQEDLARQQAMAGLGAYAAGRSPVDVAIANQALQQFGAAGAEQMGMLQQQYGQMGVTGGRLLAGMAAMQQGLGLQEAALRGDLAIAAQGRAFDATGQLANTALAGQQFELDKQRYSDTQDWTAYEAAITAGDFGTAADAYERLTGQRLSTDQLKRVQNYQNSVMDFDLQNLELQYGVNQVTAARDMINMGYGVDQVNTTLGMSLTPGDYNSIRDAAPLGERDWERSGNLANLMLQSGNPGMIEQAQTLMNEMYPGVGVDFAELITDANANQFAEVSDEMTYYADRMAWSEVPDRLKENWTATTGLTDAELESWFGGMKYNMFDEWFGQLEDSQEYKEWAQAHPDLATDFEEGIFTMLAAEMTEFRTIDAWQVRDKEGNIVGTFESSEAADRFVTANIDKGYIRDAESTGEMVVPQNWIVDGQYVVGGEEFVPEEVGIDIPEGTTVGDIFVSEGKYYRHLAEGAEPEELTFDIDSELFDPMGRDADRIIEAGEKGPYYKEVKGMRDDIIENYTPAQQMDYIRTNGLDENSEFYGTLYDKAIKKDITLADRLEPVVGVEGISGSYPNVEDVKTTDKKGAGKNYHYIEGWDDGDRWVIYDGKLYYLRPRINDDVFGDYNNTVYILDNPTDPANQQIIVAGY